MIKESALWTIVLNDSSPISQNVLVDLNLSEEETTAIYAFTTEQEATRFCIKQLNNQTASLVLYPRERFLQLFGDSNESIILDCADVDNIKPDEIHRLQ
jgi:hypothetical protein